jgi:tetratricopeptide (TPR) repeat protein
MSRLLIVGGSAADRARAARAHIPATHRVFALDSRTLPFLRVDAVAMPAAPRAVVIDEMHHAVPDGQVGGTRLVLTQSTYLLQKWIDQTDDGDVIVATGDRAALERSAPEIFQARGCWGAFEISDLDAASGNSRPGPTHCENGAVRPASPERPAPSPIATRLATAFASSDPAERLRFCREAAGLDASCEVAQLALASACRETRDGAGAREALDRAAALAPEWEAVFYESGKLSLVYDDLPRARDAFQRAADLMPTFSAAYSNLGAALGELDETEAALKAFRQALVHDPHSVTLLNNVGVVCRQLGRLDESKMALQRAAAIEPAFVFAHYNLGHTLFLAGRYPDALRAYEEGRRRDPEQNRRQGCRLAVVRLVNGDAAGAGRDLWECVDGAPAEVREDLLLEAYEIAHAVLGQQAVSEAQRAFLETLGAEIAKSE